MSPICAPRISLCRPAEPARKTAPPSSPGASSAAGASCCCARRVKSSARSRRLTRRRQRSPPWPGLISYGGGGWACRPGGPPGTRSNRLQERPASPPTNGPRDGRLQAPGPNKSPATGSGAKLVHSIVDGLADEAVNPRLKRRAAQSPKETCRLRRAHRDQITRNGAQHRRQATDETPSRAVGFCVGWPTRKKPRWWKRGLSSVSCRHQLGLPPSGLKERRQTRLLNTDPQIWLHKRPAPK